ncbi:MAG: glycosyltransferase [Methylococcales bacterium]
MKISVVIPTYNRCELLQRALRSVFSQNRLPAEVIVVDDGSTDETVAMLNKVFPQVITVHQANGGVSRARNLGIQHASGDWLAFLDSDDEWLPGKLHQQLSALTDNLDHKICHTEEQWIRNGIRVNPAKQYAKKGGWIFSDCLALCAISPSTAMIHRSVFDDIGTFDENLPACEDYDLWLRISAKYPVLLIEEPQIRKHGGHEDQLSLAYWGMDRFRLVALQKIIDSSELCDENRQAALEMLLYKAAIYLNGLIKRGKNEEVLAYQQLIEHYSGLR